MIDEAAAIPLTLVKAMLGPYLVFLCSTVNGYEGTGEGGRQGALAKTTLVYIHWLLGKLEMSLPASLNPLCSSLLLSRSQLVPEAHPAAEGAGRKGDPLGAQRRRGRVGQGLGNGCCRAHLPRGGAE